MNYIFINGKVLEDDEPVLPSQNRGYRYGDGLFETMKVINGQIQLENYHFERLKSGMELLEFKFPVLFNQEKIRDEIIQLCLKNDCGKLARVRLSVSRGSGGVYDCDDQLKYLIECWPLNESFNKLNEIGLIIDLYPDARKSVDKFSNLKSANYLPYVMAAIWAKKNNLNDALLLNSYERICDTTIANVFWIKEGIIYTPPLTEGCIAGVMRKRILDCQLQISDLGLQIGESVLSEDKLQNADEVFFTNAIWGIRWVKKFRNLYCSNKISKKIFEKITKPVQL